MGIIHRAYAFNMSQFRTDLARLQEAKGVIKFESLRGEAQKSFDRLTEFGKDFLEALSIEPCEVGASSEESYGTESLICICAAAQINMAMPMSQTSFAILETALANLPEGRSLGVLLVGQRFYAMVETLGLASLTRFVDRLKNNPSWVSNEDLAAAVRNCEELKTHFLQPSKVIVDHVLTLRPAFYSRDSVPGLLKTAWNELLQRMQATSTGADLLLVNDYLGYSKTASGQAS